MSSDTVIRAEGLGKCYLIGHQSVEQSTTFRDLIGQSTRNLVRSISDMARGRQILQGDVVEEFWALKNVSFEINRGDVVGIIGRNGAGKSTLLKVLSRITEPSAGHVEIKGRVASLLEVGTGFHPELTGRENIYLNGAILGMTRAEIKRKFDEIVDFAGVERFLDTPVKRYSSGMYVRLAFAVAAHLEPEILIVDEVLAVGDAEFQKKCLGKMKDVAGGGRTVLFVSHNMAAVRRLCARGLVLAQGNIRVNDNTEIAISHYVASTEDPNLDLGHFLFNPEASSANTSVILNSCTVRGGSSGIIGSARTDEPIEITCVYNQNTCISDYRIVFTILSQSEEIIFSSTDHDTRSGAAYAPGKYHSICRIPQSLMNRGRYRLRVRVGVPGVDALVPDTDTCWFEVDGPSQHGSSYDASWPGLICPHLDWHVAPVRGD